MTFFQFSLLNSLIFSFQTKFDVKNLYEKPKFAAQHGMVDDGSGKVIILRSTEKYVISFNYSGTKVSITAKLKFQLQQN